MTRRKTDDDIMPGAAPEQPPTGGSFIRNDDGSLTRVEHPPEGSAEPQPVPAPAEPQE